MSEGADAGNLILGRVRLAHIMDSLLKDGKEIDFQGMDPLGRLSGKFYCHARSFIESEKN